MAGKDDTWQMTYYRRAIRTGIGEALRAQYERDLKEPLPHRLLTLLCELDENQQFEETKTDASDREALNGADVNCTATQGRHGGGPSCHGA